MFPFKDLSLIAWKDPDQRGRERVMAGCDINALYLNFEIQLELLSPVLPTEVQSCIIWP